jgi:hypothetical protein
MFIDVFPQLSVLLNVLFTNARPIVDKMSRLRDSSAFKHHVGQRVVMDISNCISHKSRVTQEVKEKFIEVGEVGDLAAASYLGFEC